MRTKGCMQGAYYAAERNRSAEELAKAMNHLVCSEEKCSRGRTQGDALVLLP